MKKALVVAVGAAASLGKKMKTSFSKRAAFAFLCCYFLSADSQAGTILLGVVKYPPEPSSVTVSEEFGYVNTLVGMANGTIPGDPYTSSAGIWHDLINNPLDSLPAPVLSGASSVMWDSALSIPVDSGFNYVVAQFGSIWGEIDVVYHSTDGKFMIPQQVAGTKGISHYTAFRTTPLPEMFSLRTQSVPDGGATAGLLGVGVLGLAAIRRRIWHL